MIIYVCSQSVHHQAWSYSSSGVSQVMSRTSPDVAEELRSNSST